MPTLLIRRRRPIGEPSPAGAAVDGTVGAGRIAAAITDLGVMLGEIRQVVIDSDGPLEALVGTDHGATFDVVVIGSHLVNHPQAARRSAFLALGAHHLAPGGRLLVEHHPVDWAETAEPTPPAAGAALAMVEVRRQPPFVSAVSVYDVGGVLVRSPFTARVLSEAELDEALALAGLTRVARLGPTWLEARHRERQESMPVDA